MENISGENNNLWTGTSQWGIGGQPEKRDRGVNRQSRVREGKVCPSEWPRLNQGLSRHHRPQVEGLMTREGGVPVPSTRLQHLGDSEVLLEQKRRSDTPGLPGPRRGVRNGPPRELVRPRYRLPEPEGDRILRDLLCATSRSDKQPLTLRTMYNSAV